MSFLAKLTIDDQEYNILSFSLGISQSLHSGAARPSGMPSINELSFSIESKANSGFYAWSISPSERKDGEIIFYKRDTMASSRNLKFTGAYCIFYNETFSSNSDTAMTTSLSLSVETLEFDDSMYENPAITGENR